MVEFKLEDTVPFPQNTTHHRIDGLYLVIAPEIPTWMVVDNEEFELFTFLKSGLSIENSLIAFMRSTGSLEKCARTKMESLLYKIEENKFYNYTESILMEEADNITKNIHVFITHKCNLHCPYCYVAAGKPLKNELDIEEWKKAFLKLWEVAPNAEITFSGGEPLTKEGILEILRFTKDLGFQNFLFTNGILIDKNNIETLQKTVSLIQISLDGLSNKTHDITRGKGTFEKVMESIELVKRYDINLDLAINITPYNII